LLDELLDIKRESESQKGQLIADIKKVADNADKELA
jgi:hypothetical protein